MNIYVGNLSWTMTEQDLQDLFAPYGEVTSAKIIMDKMTSRSRGFGFVEMTDDAAGKTAIAELDGKSVQGRPLKVNEAKPKEEKSYGGGGGGRSSNGGGYNNSNSYNNNRY